MAGVMASRAKKRAVGNGVQRLGVQGHQEEEEEDEVEDEEEDDDDDEDSEVEEDEDEIVDEVRHT